MDSSDTLNVNEEITNNLEGTKLQIEDLITSDLTSIDINNLEDNESITHTTGSYKRMTVNKLREIVISKGLIDDASKLKKVDMLKLLEDN